MKLPSALMPNAALTLTNSLTITSIFVGVAFALLFHPSIWPSFAMFHVSVEYRGAQVNVGDVFGFQYIRAGFYYETMVVDLEPRTVASVLATCSAKETAHKLEPRPEIVNRDRSGLMPRASGRARRRPAHIANRFHLLINLRESVDRQITAVSCFGGRFRLPPAPGDRQSALRCGS